MMNFVQWGINLSLFVGGIILWLRFRSSTSQNAKEPVADSLTALQTRVQQLESELSKYRESFQEQLKEVESIVEQVNKALKNIRHVGGQFPMTQEESELKETLYHAPSESIQIPSVASLESTKIRLQSESHLDLKTLLRGQLS